MYPITKDFPKPLMPVAGKPVIDYLMEQITALPELRSVHVVSNTKFFKHFKYWQQNWLPAVKSKKMELRIYNDGATANENRLGAVADLQFVFQRLPKPSKALVSAGDNIFRFRLEPLWNRFLRSDTHYIIALPEADESKLRKTGVLTLGGDDQVLRFYEKPERPPSTWCCPPLYFLQISAWSRLREFIQVCGNHDAPGYFIDFLSQREKVYAFKMDASRLDIGSMDSYREADQRLSREPVFT
jgi:glucose-1-phosphate thymidylyltransferase